MLFPRAIPIKPTPIIMYLLILLSSGIDADESRRRLNNVFDVSKCTHYVSAAIQKSILDVIIPYVSIVHGPKDLR